MLYGASSDNPDDWGSQRRGIVDFDPEASGPVYKHSDDWGKFIGNEFNLEGRGIKDNNTTKYKENQRINKLFFNKK